MTHFRILGARVTELEARLRILEDRSPSKTHHHHLTPPMDPLMSSASTSLISRHLVLTTTATAPMVDIGSLTAGTTHSETEIPISEPQKGNDDEGMMIPQNE